MSENMQTSPVALPEIPAADNADFHALAAKAIKDLRLAFGLSQYKFAELIGETRGYVSQVEQGSKGLHASRVREAVAKALATYAKYAKEMNLPPPGEVDAEILAPNGRVRGGARAASAVRVLATTRREVARVVRRLREEFNVRGQALEDLLGVSGPHITAIVQADDKVSLAVRHKVYEIATREIARLERTGMRQQALPLVTTAPTTTPVTPEATVATTKAATLYQASTAEALLKYITYDYKTEHRFLRLPDGTYLVSTNKGT